MSLAEEYRAQAALCADLTRATRSLRDGSRYRKLAKSYGALAEAEDWLAGQAEKAPVGVTA